MKIIPAYDAKPAGHKPVPKCVSNTKRPQDDKAVKRVRGLMVPPLNCNRKADYSAAVPETISQSLI